jgi:Arc/MetJ-type ribon-helix-helix transcriptional regulator
MPPNGYETVTLPTEVVEMIDQRVGRGYCDSRADVIRTILEPSEKRVSAVVEVIDDDVLEELAARTAVRTADEVEERMR